MGSGTSSGYSKGNGGSQEYAISYHVDKPMLEADKKRGTYHDGHYDKNPTAEKLLDKVNGNYIGNKRFNASLPYVVDLNGNIIVGKRNGNGTGKDVLPTPHPNLIGGKDPQVKVAGMIVIRGGKIYSYDNDSGHYKPNAKSMPVADAALKKLPSTVFTKDAKRNPHK
ncbi:MAG: hypothetical protein IJS15_15310 [Victivallales bacterium]|nr:hypothetical protein [Victivallales bacterium]